MKNTVRRLLAVVMAAFMVLSLSGAVFALEGQETVAGPIKAKETASYDLSAIRNGKTFDIAPNEADDEIAADQIVPIVVELPDAPAAKLYTSYRDGKAYAETLVEKQNAAVKSIESALGVDIEVLYNYKYVANGFSFNGEYRLVEEINRMDGVSAYVAPAWDCPEIQLYNSVGMVNAIQAWDLGYTGEGDIVAVIDTGLMVDHPAFSTMPENVRFEQSDIAAIIAQGQLQGGSSMNANQVYYNAKIPFRWNYVHHNYDVTHRYNDHGTHVAGIVAGNNDEITGVAPDAQIAAMQVFADGGGAGWTEILAALDDCVVLGVDSANLSLGSPCGFTHYYSASYASTFENLVNAGVNLSMSAGNEGSAADQNAWGGYALVENPDYGVVGAPSTWARSLSIASVDNSRTAAYYITWVEDEMDISYSENADNQANLIATFGGQTLEYVAVPGYGDVDDYEGVDVAGKVALVSRGDITFVEKGQNAQANGAIACVIYNNKYETINMATDPSITIPFIIIPKDPGDAMAEAGTGSIYVGSEQGIFDNPSGGQPSDFSSWGVTSDMGFKPEITAPGGMIYSSTDPRPNMSGAYYQAWSGTSMSAPHVGGGMAIVSSYVDDVFPDLSTAEKQVMVDTILMSTANPVPDAGGYFASPRKQGAGLMDLEGATTTTAYITVPGSVRPKLELGDDPDRTGIYEMTFTVNNFGDEDLSWTVVPYILIDDLAAIAYDPNGDYVIAYSQTSWEITEDCQISAPKVITVPAGESLDVEITVDLTEANTDYLDYYYTAGAFIEGFIELYGTEGSCGDVNGDGEIDLNDALQTMRYVLELIDLDDPSVADVNRDGEINLVDALLILRSVMGIQQGLTGDLVAGVDLNVPFIAFYGDWNDSPVLDYGFYYDDFSWGSNPQDNFIGSSYGTQAYGLGINPYVETEDLSYYDPDRNAVSPNDDGFLDSTDTLRLGLLRNCAEITYTLYDGTGSMVAELAHQEDVRKDYYSTSSSSYTNLGESMPMPRWNAVPYGGQDMTIVIKAILSNDGNVTTNAFDENTDNMFNEWEIPVYVDIEAPTAEIVSYENGTLVIAVTDNHYAAFAGALDAEFVNGELVVNAFLAGEGIFEDERGMTTEITLAGIQEGNTVVIADYAGNEVAYSFEDGALTEVADSWSHAGISAPDVTFYAYTRNLTNNQYWCKFDSSDMAAQPSFGVGVDSDDGGYTAACYTGEYVYGIDANRNLIRYTVDEMDIWSNKTNLGTVPASYTIHELAYNQADGMLYAVAGVGIMMKINPANAAVVAEIDLEYGAVALDFAPDGTCYIVDLYGYLCTMDVTTGAQTSEIGYYGINPVDTAAGSFMPQTGTYKDGYFYWEAVDASITSYAQIHIMAIKVATGEYADLGNIWGGLYVLGMWAYTVELPEQSVVGSDFYENFESADFNWETVDADGDGKTWEVKYWGNGLYFDGSKAAVSYSWQDEILYPDNWMISESFTVGSNSWLSYFTFSANTGAGADIDEHWQVVIIPEGMSYADGIVLEDTIMTTAQCTEHLIDLSDYDGETVQIAFRHYDCFDEYTLIIDAIAVGPRK